jgi:CBS domain-containing protein
MRHLIKKRSVHVQTDVSIDEAIRLMINEKVSSLLVLKDDLFVGILTERDILRKLATLDIDRKLDRKINTVMSRPLRFAQLSQLEQDVKSLAKDGLRHFPVFKDADCDLAGFEGIITVSDLAREYLKI